MRISVKRDRAEERTAYRAEIERRLAASDWTQVVLLDRPALEPERVAAWAAHREALRELHRAADESLDLSVESLPNPPTKE